jgi:hypothetical protein
MRIAAPPPGAAALPGLPAHRPGNAVPEIWRIGDLPMYPLVPITTALTTLFGTSTALPGLAPDLVVRNPDGWHPASALADGQLPALLRLAERHWNARPPAAAALAWKAYTYWLGLPAVIGLLACRRVPLLRPDDVWVRLGWRHQLLTVGLRAGIGVAVLADDPLAGSGDRSITVVPDEAALLAALRRSLVEEHLTPLIAALGQAVRLHPRALLGSVAANVAGTALRLLDGAAAARPGRVEDLLSALGLAGLVELTVPDTGGPARVRRKTCCLAFTLPRPHICPDCCIRPRG